MTIRRITVFAFWGIILLAISCFSCATYSEKRPARTPYFRIQSASFSPTNAVIAIRYLDYGLGYGSGIYLIDYSGKVLRRLCADRMGRYCWEPVFTPDGKALAVGIGLEADGTDIYLGDLGSKTTRRLTNDQMPKMFWDFPEQRNIIYFVRFEGEGNVEGSRVHPYNKGSIYSLDLLSGREEALAIGQYFHVYYFSIYPDEQHYLVSTTKFIKEGHLLWKININNPSRREAIAPYMAPFAVESRAKVKIYEEVEPKNNDPNIGNKGTHGTEGELVPVRFLDIQRPKLSRDGSWLIFAWTPYKAYRDSLFVTSMSTMKTIRIKAPQRNLIPLDISNDNKKILFVTYENQRQDQSYKMVSNLWLVNRDGSGLKNINPDFSEYDKKHGNRQGEYSRERRR